MKQIWTLFLVLGLSLSGLSFADNEAVPAKMVEETGEEDVIVIQNVSLENSFEERGKAIYLPLKAVSEALGYQVLWYPEDKHVELVKGAQFISLKTTENWFSYSKMAPVALSESAYISEEGRTYVPIDFIDTLLNGTTIVSDDKVEIYFPLEDQAKTAGFVVKSIDGQRIYAELNGGEAYINVDENTIIGRYGETGDLSLADIQVGDRLLVTHPSIMTMIYPPQYVAFNIEILGQTDYHEGTIESIEENDILVNTASGVIRFNLDQKTAVLGMDENTITMEALRVGNHVSVYHSMAMTRSLPPQSYAFKIIADTAIQE